jgi:signal peptidase II
VDRLSRRGAVVLFATATAAYSLDRLTKVWAEHVLPGHPVDVIPGVLSFRYTTNSGGAFSLGQSAPWLFAGATIVVSVLIVAASFKPRSTMADVALGLVLGGALGNLTDRIVHGAGLTGRVVDFVDLHVWPIFNVADSTIVIGAILLAWTSLRTKPAPGQTPEAAGDA